MSATDATTIVSDTIDTSTPKTVFKKSGTYTSICRFNTCCKFENCKFQHAIPFNMRQKMIVICEEHPEIKKEFGREDFPLIRLAPCRFGQLCTKEACTFKHGLTFIGRQQMSNLFKETKPYRK